MASDAPTGLYMKYLQRLREQREQAGLPPASDVCDSEYWQRRREPEELKDKPREDAA